MSLITIQNQLLKVSISTVGAELQSIRDANGVERLWQGDPAFWASRAPILFPVAGGFRDDAYELDGKRYPMPKHGFVRKLEWRVEKSDAESAAFVIDDKHEGFPFEYALRAIYTLEGDALHVDYAAENLGSIPFYFSVGAHEAYATPEGIDQYTLVFDQPETLRANPLTGNLITHDTIPLTENTPVLPLTYDYFAVDALVLLSVKSRGVTLRSHLHPREIHVAFPEHDVLMLWTKPGAGYLCIEPWCNAPDFVDADPRIDHKPGFIHLAPGEEIIRRHTITAR